MGLLDEVMPEDFVFAFADTDGFAEPVTVSDGTDSWTANAVIERFPPQIIDDPKTPRPYMRAHFANDATLGIAATALDTGTYTVTVAYVKGGTAEPFRVHLPEEGEVHDSGEVSLDLW